MKFDRHDPRLIDLYWRNVGRLPTFRDDGGIFTVRSRSCPETFYKVELTPDGVECFRCRAAACGEPCCHCAVVAESVDHEREFQEKQIAKHNGIRARLPFEPKLLAKWRKVYAKDYPAVMVAPVVCEGVPF